MCNFCAFRELKQRATSRGQTVDVRPKPWPGLRGSEYAVDVYIDNVWAAWFMELPSVCQC